MLKTRFCPSPTGYLHLGNARTALISWACARAQGGSFLLRVEDTDHERSKKHFEKSLFEHLAWLGIDWDEGPGSDLQLHAPYRQSERIAIYEDYLQQLEKDGKVYPCFCSEEQLKLVRKSQLARGEQPRYPGTCRGLSQAEIDSRISAGQHYALRFRIEEGETVEFTDRICGNQSYQTSDLGDFVVKRSGTGYAFMFANAVDDALQGVTLALRGVDHIANTPRQLLIGAALGLNMPEYGHFGLLTGPGGRKLSKREGATSIGDLREQGFLGDALAQYLLRIGNIIPHDDWSDLASAESGVELERLTGKPAMFDLNTLTLWQKQAVQRLPNDQLEPWCTGVLSEALPLKGAELERFFSVVRSAVVVPSDLTLWHERIYGDRYDDQILAEEHRPLIQAGTDHAHLAAKDWKQFVQNVGKEAGVRGKQLFQPLRVILSGALRGPELDQVAEMLGTEGVQRKFTRAAERLSS